MSDIFSDLLTSMFAVAGWDLNKSHQFVMKLQETHELRLENLRDMTEDEIADLIVKSGFDRGSKVLDIMTTRVHSLATHLSESNFSELNGYLASKEIPRVEFILKDINGVGPKVIENFLLLRGIVA